MAYADNVATINSYCEELNSIYSSLSNVDFSSCWEGTAQLKQKANLDEILNAIKEQLDNCSTLTSALTKIDEYDEKNELISDYTYQMNCLSVDDENYSTNYNYLNKLRSGIITSRDNLKIEINNLLSTISSSYSSVLKSINETLYGFNGFSGLKYILYIIIIFIGTASSLLFARKMKKLEEN